MSGAQSYIVRLLRKVETKLNEQNHTSEASKVGTIIQKLAQAEDLRSALSTLYTVERFDRFALRLMWLQDAVERNEGSLESGVMDFHASGLADLAIEAFEAERSTSQDPFSPVFAPDGIDELYVGLHKFGRVLEELKVRAFQDGSFGGIQEGQLYGILNELASLKEQAIHARKVEVAQFSEACEEFIHYALDNNLVNDVRIINLLDNANITLQTVFEAGVEDNDSLQSTIELLKRPKDLLDR